MAALHSPLEEFLFFHSLSAAASIDDGAFAKTSELLRNNEFVRSSGNFDPERLSIDALKKLFISLLREEVRSDQGAKVGPARDTELGSRKRKLSTPPLPSVEAAADHKHLIPQLVNRLYSRYRDHTVDEIKNEEARYKELEQGILEIEVGKPDTKSEHGERHKRSDSKASINAILRDDSEEAPAVKVPSSTSDNAGDHVHRQVFDPIKSAQGARPQVPAQASTGPSNGAPHPYSPSPDGPLRRPLHPNGVDTVPQFSPGTGHGTGTPRPGYPTYTQYGSPHAGHQMGQVQSGQPDRPQPGSPVILPPPSAMLRSSPSVSTPAESARPEFPREPYRPVADSQPIRQRPLPGQPSPVPQRGYPHRGYQYQDASMYRPPSYPRHNEPLNSQFLYPAQGQTQPYPPPGQRYSQPGQPYGQYHSPLPFTPPAGYPLLSQGQFQVPASAPPFSHGPTQAALPLTPAAATERRGRPLQRPPIDTSVSHTPWKKVTKPGVLQRSPVRPDRSPMLSDLEDLVGGDSEPEQADSPNSDRQVKHAERGSLRARSGRRNTARGNRAGSTVSSNQGASKGTRTRSPSFASNVDTRSIQSGPAASRRVKAEILSTPAATTETSAAATPLPQSATRRRDTIKSSTETPQHPRLGLKRKRVNTIEDVLETPLPRLPERPNHIFATRNFARTVAPILNDISTHKLANMFAKPITERSAPGYSELVYRPQDLKSVRSMISAGSKAVQAAFDNAAEEGGTPGGAKPSAIWLERTLDVMPPNAIINSAQLEKELCRVFANAVMFNPDPNRGLRPARAANASSESSEDGDEDDQADDGGFVRDAREMFEAVEKTVAEFRAAERAAELSKARREEKRDDTEMDVDELDEAVEEESSVDVGRRSRRR